MFGKSQLSKSKSNYQPCNETNVEPKHRIPANQTNENDAPYIWHIAAIILYTDSVKSLNERS